MTAQSGMDGVLDDGAVLARYDPSGMLARIAELPDQIADAWQHSRRLTLPQTHRAASSVVVLGMGGSAIGADLVRGIFADRLRVPLITLRDYDLPAFADATTLAIASSYSGATEETISALTQALERHCPVAAITTGGPLRSVAERAELPMLTFEGGGQPRAAIGHGMLLLAGLLERAGYVRVTDEDVAWAVDAARAAVARCEPAVPTASNPAKQLAWSLVDRLPVIEGSGHLAPVARRWKTQLNENAKSTAVWEELPEATHNAIVGYAQPETLHERMFFVFLASPAEHPRNARRAGLSTELLSEAQIAHQVVPAAGQGRLAEASSLIALGDFVSAYLAVLYGLDPTPVEAIARLKQQLAALDADSSD